MLVPHRCFIRRSWVAVIPVFAAVSIFAQSAAGPGTPAATTASPAPASEAVQAVCPHSAVTEIPFSSTIQAKVPGTLDAAHLKVGKEIWVNVVNGLVYPGCTLNEGAALYGHIKAIVAGKDANTAELALAFDHADCEGHSKKEMPLRLVGMVAPPGQLRRAHEALPLALKGASRNINDAVTATNFADNVLNPGGTPHTVQVGVVAGLPKIKLEITGGPGCSSRILSTDHSVQLDRGTELILIVQSDN